MVCRGLVVLDLFGNRLARPPPIDLLPLGTKPTHSTAHTPTHRATLRHPKSFFYVGHKKRSEAVKKARDANRQFVEAMVEDLPDLCQAPEVSDSPPRPVCEFRDLSPGSFNRKQRIRKQNAFLRQFELLGSWRGGLESSGCRELFRALRCIYIDGARNET